MALAHPNPNEVIDLSPLGPLLPDHKTYTLFKSEQLEVLRLVLPAGKVIAEHRAPGEITVQCLEGAVEFEVHGEARELRAGHMLYVAAREPHALKAIEDSSVLVTIQLKDA